MTGFVVDAGVAIKRTIPEDHSAAALCYLDSSVELHAPESSLAEIAIFLWKKSNRREITTEQCLQIADGPRQVDITIHPMGDPVLPALSIALATGRSAYDSMYPALAETLSIGVVTADRRLFNGILGGAQARRSRWVGSPP